VHTLKDKRSSPESSGLFLTRYGRECSVHESTWFLAVVTDALGSAKHLVYTPKDMEE